MINLESDRKNAILVAVQLPDVSAEVHASNLAELGRLVHTLGYHVLTEVSQKRPVVGIQAVLGEGRLKDLAKLTGGTGNVRAKRRKSEENESDEEDFDGDEEDFDGDDDEVISFGADDAEDKAKKDRPPVALIAVNHDLSPRQARNLERATGVAVLDRTGVIVEIFHRNARSQEARLQVEIARLRYTTPRVRESSFGKERQQGRGAGESALELDKRKVRDRIKELEIEIEKIAKERETRREARRQSRRVALVGYTNAGKSSLMRALTRSDVLVQDKLFATLDTTVRALHPATKPRILMTDTVGFIQDLPHDLVASFKSTLDEARDATLVLHVVDCADPNRATQMEVTEKILDELKVATIQLVWNKVDQLTPEEQASLRVRFPGSWFVSAHDSDDVARLRQRIIDTFAASYEERTLRIPYHQQEIVAELHEETQVLREDYAENGCLIRVKSDVVTLAKYNNWVWD
jgi:GTPase